jgi:hypothetical protein
LVKYSILLITISLSSFDFAAGLNNTFDSSLSITTQYSLLEDIPIARLTAVASLHLKWEWAAYCSLLIKYFLSSYLFTFNLHCSFHFNCCEINVEQLERQEQQQQLATNYCCFSYC